MGEVPRFMFTRSNSEFKDIRRELRYSQTFAEKLLWNALRAKQLGVHFRRQHSVGKYILDFYCAAYYLAVELDGAVHASDEAKHRDKIRTQFLSECGIRVIRFSNDEVFADLDEVVRRIREWCVKSTSLMLPPR
jgi:very-short-patch-repair endonuclease